MNVKPMPMNDAGIVTLVVMGLALILIGYSMYQKFKSEDDK